MASDDQQLAPIMFIKSSTGLHVPELRLMKTIFCCPNSGCNRAFKTSRAVASHLSHPNSLCVHWLESLLSDRYSTSSLSRGLEDTSPEDGTLAGSEDDEGPGTDGSNTDVVEVDSDEDTMSVQDQGGVLYRVELRQIMTFKSQA
jgi:hypothetical protein